MRSLARSSAVVAVFVALSTVSFRASSADGDPWLGRDKAKHFGASAVIAGGGYGVAAPLTTSRATRALVGASVALAAGFAKEGWDLAGHGQPSYRDLAWDFVGTAFGVALSLAVDLAVRPKQVGLAFEPLVLRW